MSLNSHWIPKYQPSKLNEKSLSTTTKTDVFLDHSTLTAGILGSSAVGVQRHTLPHFKALIKLDWNQTRPRAWQHFYPPPRPLE